MPVLEKACPSPDHQSGRTVFVGRERELGLLDAGLDRLFRSAGSTFLVTGEPGAGKTRLVEELKGRALSRGAKVICGSAAQGNQSPFHLFSGIMPGDSAEEQFSERESVGFAQVFAIDKGGSKVAEAGAGGVDGLSADAMADVIAAVQSFVGDSLGKSSGAGAGLGRLEYGGKTILLEHGAGFVIAGIVPRGESERMRLAMRNTLAGIESSGGGRAAIEARLSELAALKFIVRRDLGEVNIERERIRVADMFLEKISAFASEKPVLLVLEDLHWADAPSLLVLQYLARVVVELPLMVVSTVRPSEDAKRMEALSQSMAAAGCARIDLRELDESAVASLVEGIIGANDFTPDFLSGLQRQSGGNPFFVVELLGQMGRDGAIVSRDGISSISIENLSIPSSVEDVARRRLDSLEPEEVAIAEYASCIGQEFDVEVATSFHSATDAAGSLDGLVSMGILSRSGNRLAFAHAIIHSVIYADIAARWKSTHHRSIGLFLESKHGADLDAVIYDVANQFARSNEHAKASGYCVMAAEKAEGSYALELAKDFYGKAMASSHAAGGSFETVERKADLLERLSGVCAVLGEFDIAIRYLDEALPLASRGSARVRVLRKYGYVYNRMGKIDESITKLDEALVALEVKSGSEYGIICTTLGNNLWYKGEVDKALSYTDKAIEIFSCDEPDENELADAFRVKALILSGTGKHDMALDVYRRSLDIWTKLGNERRMAAMLGNMGNVFAEKGEFAKSLEYYEKGLVLLRKLRHKHNIAVMTVNMGATYYSLGNIDKAIEFFKESGDAFGKIGDAFGLATTFLNTGAIYLQFGEYDEAKDVLVKGLAIAEKNHITGTASSILEALGGIFVESKDYAKAEEFFARSLEIAKNGRLIGMVASGHTNMADMHSEMRNVEKAIEWANESLRISEENGLDREGAIAKIALGRARLLAVDLPKAAELFESAKTAFEGMGERTEVAITEYFLGSVYRTNGEAAKAKGFYEKALATFEECKFKVWAAKTRKELDAFNRE
ncbi:MAG: tetratricopeptide repeat protein [Methanobacteriota archaeon]